MKAVLNVDGKQLEVTSINYVNGEVKSVQVHLGDNKYEHYQCSESFRFDPDDKLIDFSKALKFIGRYDDLIQHLEKTLRGGNENLIEIAIEAMEGKESSLPFNSHLTEAQRLYQSEKQRVMGMLDMTEEAKAFAEGWYDDEKSASTIEKTKHHQSIE